MFEGRSFFTNVAALGTLGAAGFSGARMFEIEKGHQFIEQAAEYSFAARGMMQKGYTIPFFNEVSKMDDYAVWAAIVAIVALLASAAFKKSASKQEGMVH